MAAGDFPDWRHLVRCVEEAIGPCPGQYAEPSDPTATLEEAPQRGQDASGPEHAREADEAPVMEDFAGHIWRVQDNGSSAVLERMDPNGVILAYADEKGSVSVTTAPTPPLETIEVSDEEDLRTTRDPPPDDEMPVLVPIDTPGEDAVMGLALVATPPPIAHSEADLPLMFASWAAEMEWEDRLRERETAAAAPVATKPALPAKPPAKPPAEDDSNAKGRPQYPSPDEDWVLPPRHWRIRVSGGRIPRSLVEHVRPQEGTRRRVDRKFLFHAGGEEFRVHINKRDEIAVSSRPPKKEGNVRSQLAPHK
ncbi:uncharacterized protein [Drosophila takahashii]|uniref:uncharacterized protein n=1 Tax=Drosophila takahashii TaxID=29030 RepID=UPI0038990723